jgi:acetyl-CoA synthetase
MNKEKIYNVPKDISEQSNVSESEFQVLYKQSLENPDEFWSSQAESYLDWDKKWEEVKNTNIEKGEIAWFSGGKLNATVNCIDRHLPKDKNKIAFIWEGDDPEESKNITYQDLHDEVCKFSNVLKARGVKKGDRVCIYMPMIPEATYAMLACARIGAIHSVVFGGFSPESLKDRILDSDCQTVITTDEGLRGGKTIPLKQNVDEALEGCSNVHTVLVITRTEAEIPWNEDCDVRYEEISENVPNDCTPELMDAEDPLFILYTSGSTGKPKGVLHTTGGYLLQAAMSYKLVFDYKENEVYWCTADVGWVTGHSYIVYGPLANGATSVIFEGIPTHPSPSRFWEVIDKHKVNIFYTAPTALRALMAQGDDFVESSSRESLRILGTVGEPINPEAWEWYFKVVGNSSCPIVDTWWQTETGAMMITPVAGFTAMKPGSATKPFLGIEPALLDENGEEIVGEGSGNLVIKSSWPSQIRTVYGDHQRCVDTYYSMYPGYYTTGDGARRDADGYYWITGRVDYVLNVSGHRLGTAEVESALVLHQQVAEAAVVGYEHEIKGQGIYCYVTLMSDVAPNEELKSDLIQLVAKEIGPIAKPDIIQWAPGLPKTRSGKIMRRILRKIATNEIDNLGDTTTLADPSVVKELILNRENK